MENGTFVYFGVMVVISTDLVARGCPLDMKWLYISSRAVICHFGHFVNFMYIGGLPPRVLRHVGDLVAILLRPAWDVML